MNYLNMLRKHFASIISLIIAAVALYIAYLSYKESKPNVIVCINEFSHTKPTPTRKPNHNRGPLIKANLKLINIGNAGVTITKLRFSRTDTPVTIVAEIDKRIQSLDILKLEDFSFKSDELLEYGVWESEPKELIVSANIVSGHQDPLSCRKIKRTQKWICGDNDLQVSESNKDEHC